MRIKRLLIAARLLATTQVLSAPVPANAGPEVTFTLLTPLPDPASRSANREPSR